MIQHIVTRFVFGCILAVFPIQGAFSALLTVQFSAEPTQYDPLMLEDGTALKVAANTLGTLFYYDGRGERFKGLLDTYSVSRDRLHYTFRFKRGLKWSDGKAFHADQFMLALKRVVESPVKAALSNLYPAIDLKASRVSDSTTVEVVLKSADEQFPSWLTTPAFAPLRPDLIEAYQKGDPCVPTLGAYRVVEHKRESHLLLKKNPEYYGAKGVSIEEVKIRFIGEEASLVPLLKSGAIDILSKVPALQAKEISGVASLVEEPVEAVTYLAFNTKKAPFSEKKNRIFVRDALTSAKKSDLARILLTGEIAATSFVPAILIPGGFHHGSPHLPQKAKEKLSFAIQSDSGSRNQTMLEYVQGELKGGPGFEAKLELTDWKAHYARLKTDPAEMYRFGWQNPVSDPSIVYDVLTSKSPDNFTGWKNAEYDELVGDLRQETRMVKRSKLIHELEEILWEEAPVVPLLHQVLRFGVSKRVSGFRANPFGVILFRELHLAADSTVKN